MTADALPGGTAPADRPADDVAPSDPEAIRAAATRLLAKKDAGFEEAATLTRQAADAGCPDVVWQLVGAADSAADFCRWSGVIANLEQYVASATGDSVVSSAITLSSLYHDAAMAPYGPGHDEGLHRAALNALLHAQARRAGEAGENFPFAELLALHAAQHAASLGDNAEAIRQLQRVGVSAAQRTEPVTFGDGPAEMFRTLDDWTSMQPAVAGTCDAAHLRWFNSENTLHSIAHMRSLDLQDRWPHRRTERSTWAVADLLRTGEVALATTLIDETLRSGRTSTGSGYRDDVDAVVWAREAQSIDAAAGALIAARARRWLGARAAIVTPAGAGRYFEARRIAQHAVQGMQL